MQIRTYRSEQKIEAFYWEHGMEPLEGWVQSKVTPRGPTYLAPTPKGMRLVVNGCYHVLTGDDIAVLSKGQFESVWHVE